jgi:hypothetical protein
VAVFASSGVIKADLTSDLKALHDALFSLRSTVPVSRKQDCPRLTDFQAQHIYDRNDDENEIELALIEANLRNCHLPGGESGESIVRQLAFSTMSQYRRRAQRSIAGLHELVNWMAYIPGEKAVILTSAGFLSEDL